MSALVEDVIKANMVLVGYRLLKTEESIEAFRQQIGTDVSIQRVGLEADLATGRTDPAIGISLPRERISMHLSTARSEIAIEYPTLEAIQELGHIAGRALALSPIIGDPPRAFGYNVEVVFNQDSNPTANLFIARKLFGGGPLHPSWNLLGGNGQMIFDDNGRRWQVAIAPRFQEESTPRVFLSLNLHIPESRLPSTSEIVESLRLSWETAHGLVAKLDTRI